MATYTRVIEALTTERLKPGKVVLIYGARRVGKTILLKNIVNAFQGKILSLNGESFETISLFGIRTREAYRQFLDEVDLLAIDEAQNIPDIGKVLKFIVDEFPLMKVLVTGSSSFDLVNKAGEPLVGRGTKLLLSPFSSEELSQNESPLDSQRNLDQRLIYGTYPDVILTDSLSEKAEYLRDVVDAYLLKDILSIDGIRSSSKMLNLLRLIAFQSGSIVSCDELGKQLGLSRNTIEKYLDLLEKVFVIYRVGAYSGNLRKELSKAAKWYFCDTGIRNAVINDFSPLSMRNDVGALWENFMVSERRKLNHNHRLGREHYFWRTYDRQEVDLLEVCDGSIDAFEFKWGDKTPSAPKAFSSAYPEATFSVVSPKDYLTFAISH